MTETAKPLDPEEMPLPMGVYEHTGQLLPPLSPAAHLSSTSQPDPAVLARGAAGQAEFLVTDDVDPNVLSEAGWGIIFPATIDPAIREALTPLIEHRRAQVSDTRVFRVFEGDAGYQTGESVRDWLNRMGVGFAVVDPLQGVPLYLTLIGTPLQIPFEYQYMLDTYWSVGRLAFDRPEDYAAYAEQVIRYEKATALPHGKYCAVFVPKTLGDRSTSLLHDVVGQELVYPNRLRRPLGDRHGFRLQPLLGPDATKENLFRLLRGELDGGVPALLFTGSHGLAVEFGREGQLQRQGAIVCQDWEGGPIDPVTTFAAEDLPSDMFVPGLIHFLFACYGGGTPEFDSCDLDPNGRFRKLATQPFVARLPQRLLLAGALAVLAHIDRAWSYSFLAGRSVPQVNEFRDVMTRILKGDRIGQATDQFNLRWAVLASELTEAERTRKLFPDQVSEGVLANRWVAYMDARNYLVFGDPAVRLRVEDMAVAPPM